MKTKRILLGLGSFIVGMGMAHATIFLPPAGDDEFPTVKATLTFNISGGPSSLQCAGPITVHRSDPSSSIVQTEIVALDLVCAAAPGAVDARISLNPSQGRSFGLITDTGSSYFDVFLQITGLSAGTLHNTSPLRLQANIAHVAPWNAQYSNLDQVVLFNAGAVQAGILIGCIFPFGTPTKPENSGEVSPVFSCFYECKPNRFLPLQVWREVTTLMLVNQSNFPIQANLLIIDGNENSLRWTNTLFSPQDLDEINVCETLNLAGVPPPQAGVVEVVLTSGFLPPPPLNGPPVGGAYGWIKNVVGSFVRGNPEPFAGFVSAVGKAECRLVGPNVETPQDLLNKISQVNRIAPSIIEGTQP